MEIRCFQCGKMYEPDEIYDINIGNKFPVKMCFICKKKHEKAIKGGPNWKGQVYPKKN